MSRTHLYLLLDRSGSMASIADDVIGGVNTFVPRGGTPLLDATGRIIERAARPPS